MTETKAERDLKLFLQIPALSEGVVTFAIS